MWLSCHVLTNAGCGTATFGLSSLLLSENGNFYPPPSSLLDFKLLQIQEVACNAADTG